MPEHQKLSLQEITESAQRLVSGTLAAADAAGNEANLRHEVELLLRQACQALGIPYVPYQFERALRGDHRHVAFADVVHGGVIIEYEPRNHFLAAAPRPAFSTLKTKLRITLRAWPTMRGGQSKSTSSLSGTVRISPSVRPMA